MGRECGPKALLLNASNMETLPVYPYAFIQVPAVARRAGVQVVCKDLLGIPRERWAQTVQGLIGEYDPAMVLVTLRNLDSHVSGDYEGDGSKAYFPIERTRALIAAVRAVCDLPIVLGGFAFSLLAHELMDYLRPDLGVVGGADAFFAHFEEVRAGHPGGVTNLLYFQGERIVSNPRLFFPPLADTEYTPQAIEEMMAFYDAFPSPGFEGAPIEVMRGCCHACVFCSEPHVVGKQVRYRDLAAVMGDIEILVDHGIRRLYMISSELNPQGNGFALQLADRIGAFNEGQAGDGKVSWFGANYLLNFSVDEYERLHRSGFTGGWFDATALDDENARAMRTPYRNASLVSHLKTYAQCERRRLDQIQARGTDLPAGPGDADPAQDGTVGWSLFLGNPATTPETMRNTLRVANEEGLAGLFDRCYLNPNIRVFDYEDPDEATLAVTYSVTPDLERSAYRQRLPSFAYPPALLQGLGPEEEIVRMFKEIAETYLSTRYRRTRDWQGFVQEHTTPAAVAGWIGELSGVKGVRLPDPLRPEANGEPSGALQRLFAEEPEDKEGGRGGDMAEQVVSFLLSACLEAFPYLFGALGLPDRADRLARITPYELAVAVYGKWRSEEGLMKGLEERAGPGLGASMQELVRFCVRAMLYRFNVRIDPRYRGLFVSGGSSPSWCRRRN